MAPCLAHPLLSSGSRKSSQSDVRKGFSLDERGGGGRVGKESVALRKPFQNGRTRGSCAFVLAILSVLLRRRPRPPLRDGRGGHPADTAFDQRGEAAARRI